ncbi:MAG TPA: hypothetical protein VJ801_15985, partial [Polyangia bacterium]|nr:hypothetical protein [Polyangia bacterium]
MPAESCEGIARRPVQLTFDGFIVGPAENGRKLRASRGRHALEIEAGKAGLCCKYSLRGTLAPRCWAP